MCARIQVFMNPIFSLLGAGGSYYYYLCMPSVSPSYATHVLQVTTLELNIVQCLQDFNVKKSYIPP